MSPLIGVRAAFRRGTRVPHVPHGLRVLRGRVGLLLYRAKRRARTRCATCGRPFGWRERPIMVATARDPRNVPSWWHGEEHLHHSACIDRPRLAYLVEGPAMLG